MRRWGLVVLAIVLPWSGQALQVERSPEALCAVADLVLIGEVTGLETRWAQGSGGHIETVADLAVERVLLGAPLQDLRVVTRGGLLQGLVEQVEDSALLVPDRRYLLLLSAREEGGWRVVGGPDGAVSLSWGPQGPGTPEPVAVEALGGCLAR